MLLFPLWFPSVEAALGYARLQGRPGGCDIRINNSEGGLIDRLHFRPERSPARLKPSSTQRNALELLACNQELRLQVDSLTRLEWELMQTNEREHRRYGWDLHEDLGQQLSGITFLASLLAKQLETDCPNLGEELRELVGQLRDAVLHTRNIARGIYPIGLENGGLFMVLEELANCVTNLERVPCQFRNDDRFHYPQESAIHLYRIAEEGVNHLVKNGKAQRISIECRLIDSIPRLLVTGEGVERFEPCLKEAWLELMVTRAKMIGASIEVTHDQEDLWRISCSLKVD